MPLNAAILPAQKSKALVVDDEATSRLLLKGLLERQGFQSVQARNGLEALEIFARETPDIVFVDVVMPGLSGYDTARRLKAMAGERFVPVIFLTSLTDDTALAKCIEAGGDDFLNKPISAVLLQAKVSAAARTSHLYRTVQQQRHQLLFEQELATQVYAKTVTSDQGRLGTIRNLQRPASVFSGDILLVERSPSGALHVLVGDFTGHGLAAAIGALPAAEVFRGMSAKGFTAAEILVEINRKLRQTLPTGMFLAAAIVSLSQDGRSATIRNSGLPDVLVLDHATGRIRQRIVSSSVPLGVIGSLGQVDMEWVELSEGDQIVVLTDGIVEARNPSGEFYTDERLAVCLENGAAEQAFERLMADLDDFTNGAPQEDDLTLAMIPCATADNPVETRPVSVFSGESAAGAAVAESGRTEPSWQWNLDLRATTLQRLDVVPLLVGSVVEMQGLQDYRQPLFTVLSELFNNALDHGLLGLDSSLKDSLEGFAQYFRERQQRLAHMEKGIIRIGFATRLFDGGGEIEIRVEDDGPGFDFESWLARTTAPGPYSGRGIALVRALCESLTYEGPGNIARAVYRWPPARPSNVAGR